MPHHTTNQKVAPTIDLEEITEGTIQALIGLPSGGLRSIENPSTKILTEYFREYSLGSKTHETQGDEDPMF